jgi:hypothetical protein
VLGVAALVGLSLARGEEVGDKAAGVVSVMMAKKVAWFIGAACGAW